MKFALIGCGALGLSYAAAAAELKLPIAVCADLRAAAAKKAAAKNRARATTACTSSVARKDIDAVLLCAPARSVPGYLKLAAKSGKHVLVASSALAGDAARKAFEAVSNAGIHVSCAYDTRVAPELNAILGQLDQNAIGKPGFVRIVRVGASPHPKVAAGALATLFPPDLDWLIGRFGATPRLFAHTTRAPGLDHAAVTLTFKDGPIVQWVGTCRVAGSPRTYIEICGSGGMIQFNTDELVLELSRNAAKSSPSVQRVNPLSPSFAARHLSSFIHLLESKPDAASCDREIAVLSVLDAALDSARTGHEIRT